MAASRRFWILVARRVHSRLAWLAACHPLLVGFTFLALGIVAQNTITFTPPYGVIIALCAVGLVGGRYMANNTGAVIRILGVLIAIVCFGGWLHAHRLRQAEQLTACSPATDEWRPIHLLGIVESIPVFRPDTSAYSKANEEDPWVTTIDVRAESILSTENGQPVSSRISGLVRIAIPGRLRTLIPGDSVDCLINWRRLQPPANPGQIDMTERYRQYGIIAQGTAKTADQITRRNVTQWWRVDRYLAMIAMRGDEALERYVFFNQSELAAALVLGQRDQIEFGLQESLLETGTIHMLAISGLHVEMVAASVLVTGLLIGIRLPKVLIILVFAVVCYAVICGMKPPVLRATILVITVCIARWRGQPISSLNLLAFAALVLLAINTDYLWDTGTQLSFLAVAVLMLTAVKRHSTVDHLDALNDLLRPSDSLLRRLWEAVRSQSRSVLTMSFWVWLITTPLVVYTFHVIAPIAIVMNLLLIIPLWIGLLSGLLLVLLATWLPGIGYVLGFLCGSALQMTQALVTIAQLVPYGHWWMISPPTWWVVTFYIILMVALAVGGFSSINRRTVAAILLGWLAVGAVPWYAILPDNRVVQAIFGHQGQSSSRLAVTFIDVGHGTSVIIETPTGETWLYDAGRLGDPLRSFYPMANTLWYLKKPHIDRLILSHADMDHFNAVPGLARRFSIGQVATTEFFMASQEPSVQPILEDLRRQKMAIQTYSAGDYLVELPNWTCKVLHPRGVGLESDNAVSLSLLIEFAGRHILLPGDLEGSGVVQLMQQPPMRIDVLMAPHHGSLADDPEPLLGWAKPSHVVISGASRSAKKKVIDKFRGAVGRDVWVTARDHAIRFEYLADEDQAIAQELVSHWTGQAWESLELQPSSVTESSEHAIEPSW